MLACGSWCVPPVHELIGGRLRLSDIREVDIADLLGRHQVTTNVREIAGYLTDRVVLVTGAGGSIGSELARQIHQYGPRELVLLDRDESALHAVQLSIYGQGAAWTPRTSCLPTSATRPVWTRSSPSTGRR